MPNEADTCRTYVVPKLYDSDWRDEQIAEQRTFIAGRILVNGRIAVKIPGGAQLRVPHLRE